MKRLIVETILLVAMLISGFLIGKATIFRERFDTYIYEIDAWTPEAAKFDEDYTSYVKRSVAGASSYYQLIKDEVKLNDEDFRKFADNIDKYRVYTCPLVLFSNSTIMQKNGYFVVRNSPLDLPIAVDSNRFDPSICTYPGAEQRGIIHIYLPVEGKMDDEIRDLLSSLEFQICVNIPYTEWACGATFSVVLNNEL